MENKRYILKWSNIEVTSRFKSKKPILSDVTGWARDGELLAIMGSSGAGKSSLMNVLAKRNLKRVDMSGKIDLNGREFSDDVSLHHAGYIQQEDYFISSLTVREHLRYNAKLVLGPSKDLEHIVEDKIQLMALQNCSDDQIGDPLSSKRISGGERKRLAIATEILSDPLIIFADEPTSGLDSFMAFSVIDILKKLAAHGTIVICTIHQPSIKMFNEMNSVMLLALGKVIYMGPICNVENYFSSIGKARPAGTSLPDHIINLAAYSDFRSQDFNVNLKFYRNKIDALNTSFQNSDLYKHLNKEIAFFIENAPSSLLLPEKRIQSNPFHTFTTLLHRTIIDQLRDKEFKAKCIQHLITAIVIGLIFLRTPWNEKQNPYLEKDVFNINGAITILIVFFSFAFVYLVIYKFPQMKKLLRREHYNGLYPIYSVYMAEIVSGLPFNFLMPLIFMVITYFLIGFKPSVGSFFGYYFTFLLVSLSASGFGYVISALAPSPQWASSIAPPLITPLFIFCGIIVKLNAMPPYIQWLKYMSWFYYGTENLFLLQWSDVNYCWPENKLISPNTIQCYEAENGTYLPVRSCTPNDPLCSETTDSRNNVCPPGSIIVPGTWQIQAYGFEMENYNRNVVCLIGWVVAFRIIGLLILQFRFRKSKR